MKVCSLCKQELPYSDFNLRSRSVDGYNASCKGCRSQRRKTYISQTAYNKKHYHENKEFSLKRKELWYKENPGKKAAHRKKHRESNLEAVREAERLKGLKRRTRVPPWLTTEQKKEIQYFYKLRDEVRMLTGDEYHVDHIVPLQGNSICGLHVPWNLQVLPAKMNLSKGSGFSANTGGMQ